MTFMYFSRTFLQIHLDKVQLNMLRLAQLWKIPKEDFLVDPRKALSFKNLKQARSLQTLTIEQQA